MRVKLLEWADWRSPGTIDPDEGCRPREDPGWVDIEITNPRLREMIERDGGLYVPFPALLTPEHFSDERASPEIKTKLKAASSPEETGRNSLTVRGRLSASCCGWRRQPNVAEFHQALKSDPPTDREAAILHTWAAEANASELLHAWAEDAYTFRELAAALHRAGIKRSPMSVRLNNYHLHPESGVRHIETDPYFQLVIRVSLECRLTWKRARRVGTPGRIRQQPYAEPRCGK